jgi:DNA primase
MLAEVLASHVDPTTTQTQGRGEDQTATGQIANALQTLQVGYLQRRQRELRGLIAEAERRGDTAMVETLTMEKIKIDRAMRGL